MNEFKVGDWVTLLDKWVHKVEAVSKNGRVLFLNTREIPRADNWWGIDQCTPWEPKEGEWCWFWDTITPHRPTLRQFGKYEEDYFTDTEHNPFTSCEPFFGELPSFLRSTHATN